MDHSARVECGDRGGKSPVLLNSAAQAATENRPRPTAMRGERKFVVQSRWPARPAVPLRRKLQDRQVGLEIAETRKAKVVRIVCGPIPNPRGRGIKKSGARRKACRIQATGFILRALAGTHRKMRFRRKASGDGRGHDGRQIQPSRIDGFQPWQQDWMLDRTSHQFFVACIRKSAGHDAFGATPSPQLPA